MAWVGLGQVVSGRVALDVMRSVCSRYYPLTKCSVCGLLCSNTGPVLVNEGQGNSVINRIFDYTYHWYLGYH